jgi:hypothetical protein
VGENAKLGELDHDSGIHQKVDTTNNSLFTLAIVYGLESHVKGCDGGRAGSVDTHRGTMQVENVADSVGGDGESSTSDRVGVDGVSVMGGEGEVLLLTNTDKYTSLASLVLDTSILKGLKRNLQQHFLLRVHLFSLTLGDTEGLVVEIVDVINKTAARCQSLAGTVLVC